MKATTAGPELAIGNVTDCDKMSVAIKKAVLAMPHNQPRNNKKNSILKRYLKAKRNMDRNRENFQNLKKNISYILIPFNLRSKLLSKVLTTL